MLEQLQRGDHITGEESMKSFYRTLGVGGVLALGAASILAPAGAKAGRPNVAVKAAGTAVQRGKTVAVPVQLTIPRPYHANANPASISYLIPTTVKLNSAAGIRAGGARYPKGKMKKFSFSDKSISVYEGTISVRVPVTASANAKPGVHQLTGTLRYQACDDKSCYAPVNKKFNAAVRVK
jgi:hypothetical protein